jgi:O-antigen/teichoic acid export membrane protein
MILTYAVDFLFRRDKMSSKASDIAKISTKNGFHYLWGLVVSTVVSSLSIIVIARMLGADLYGLYGIAFIVPNLIITFRDWGINSAIVKFSAQYRAEERKNEIRGIILSGVLFELFFGFVLMLVSIAVSNYVAISIYNRPALAPLIQLASLSILTSGIISAATGIFTGFERMALNSVMIVCQAIIRTLAIIGLILLGLNTTGAVMGSIIGSLFAGIVGAILIRIIYIDLRKNSSGKLEMRKYFLEMMKFATPLSISFIITGFLTQFYSFLLPIYYSDNVAVANYSIAQNFVVLIGFFAAPITTVLFPAFSKLDAKKDKEALRNVFLLSVKYSSLIVIPVVFLIICLSQPAISTLFGNTYSSAALFLSLLALTYLYVAFGSLSSGNLINSQGNTKLTLKLTILTGIIGFPLGVVLILELGVIGLIISLLVSYLPNIFLSLFIIKKNYGFTIDWVSSIKILLSSALSFIFTYFVISRISNPILSLLVGLSFFLLILLPSLVLTKAISATDITTLQAMFEGFGHMKFFINRGFAVLEKLVIIYSKIRLR